VRGGQGLGRLALWILFWLVEFAGAVAEFAVFHVFLPVFFAFGRGEAEDVVDVADDGVAFGVGEFAVGVFERPEGSAGLGAGLAVFLDEHGFAAGAGEGVEETGEGGGVAAEFEVQAGFSICDFRFTIGWTRFWRRVFLGRCGACRGEVTEGFEDVKGGELEGGVVDLGGIEIEGEIGGGFLALAGAGEPVLQEEKILVAAFFPLTLKTAVGPFKTEGVTSNARYYSTGSCHRESELRSSWILHSVKVFQLR